MRLALGIITFILIISLVVNIIFLSKQSNLKGTSTDGLSTDQYPLLARRILIENPNDILVNFFSLRKQLREAVAEYGNTFAFYFEYLPTGVSIGVNEKDDFVGASLIKLPVVMAFYHQLERQGASVAHQIVKIQSEDLDRGFGDLWIKGEGYEISLKEAARLAIIDSDNTAANVLARNVLKQDFDEVYEGLDIELHSENGTTFIAPKSYSSILKALYFSAVLKKESSQEILELLSHSSVDDKLRAPLLGNIVVANKFGVYKNETFQDCGIVYLPKRNYLLCMMSKSDELESRERMTRISKLIFDYVREANYQ